jgi:hypothetical protein
METFKKALRILLIVLTFFLSITAALGGIALMANLYTPPVDYLQGSIFTSFAVPGLALCLLVGGGALLAAILLLRKNKYATLSAATAGIMIMFFEFVEVLIIGSDPGPARFMQVFYFGLGTAVEMAALGIWFMDLRKRPI